MARIPGKYIFTESNHSDLFPVATLPTCCIGIRMNSAAQMKEIVFMPPGSKILSLDSARDFVEQLQAYLNDPKHGFSMNLVPRGTDYQQRVWQAIRDIPCGETRRYGELAQILNSSARAVGQACGANPFPLITPCHRVLALSGTGGFAHARGGWLIETKRWLLNHERAL